MLSRKHKRQLSPFFLLTKEYSTIFLTLLFSQPNVTLLLWFMNKVSSNCDRYSIYLLVLYIVCNQTHHLCVVWCFAERNIFLAHYRALTHSLTPHMLFSPRVVSHRPSGPTESIPQIVPEKNPRVCLVKKLTFLVHRYTFSSNHNIYVAFVFGPLFNRFY